MTKAEIVEQIYEQVGFSKKEAAELVETVFESFPQIFMQMYMYFGTSQLVSVTWDHMFLLCFRSVVFLKHCFVCAFI